MRARTFSIAVVMAALLAPALALADDANHVVGSGNLIDQTRSVGDFTGVQASTGIEVKLQVGPRAVSIRAEDNIQPLIRAEVEHGTLEIGWVHNASVSTQKGVVITVTAPRLDSVSASAGSRIDGSLAAGDKLSVAASAGSMIELEKNLATKQLEVTLSGGSQLHAQITTDTLRMNASGGSSSTLAGSARDAVLHLSGAASCDADALTVATVEIQGSGASSASVGASSAKGELSGASRLEVPQAAKVDVATSGASGVGRR